MEEAPEPEGRKRDRRQAVLNSMLLREIMDSSGDEDSDKEDHEDLPAGKHPHVHFQEDKEDEPAERHPHTTQKHGNVSGDMVEKERAVKSKKKPKASVAADIENEGDGVEKESAVKSKKKTKAPAAAADIENEGDAVVKEGAGKSKKKSKVSTAIADTENGGGQMEKEMTVKSKRKSRASAATTAAEIENEGDEVEKEMTLKPKRKSRASAPAGDIENEGDEVEKDSDGRSKKRSKASVAAAGVDIENESDEVEESAGKFKKKAKASVSAADIENENDVVEKESAVKSKKKSKPLLADVENESHGVETTVKPKKKSKASSAAAADIENESLIEIIKHKGKFVELAASKWLERYEANPTAGLNELLVVLFEACGVTLDLKEEPLSEMDVDDVVKELVSHAEQGGLEDILGSKQKDSRNFKENLVTFWDTIVRESQEGALFDQQLMEKCMDHVIALSCTQPRVFRIVASLVGLQLVTSLVAVAKSLGQSRETAQRQLNAEKKKRKEGPRIESLNKILSEKHEKITMVEEMMRKMFTGLFMHRYRDVDPEIRQACISAMGSWIVSYPSLFLQDLYLKYIGWTLNDKNPVVRKSSISALQELYAVDDNVPSLSLFTARFGRRMVEMADDVDMTVAISAIGLLKQLLRHQLLSDEDLGSLYDLLIDDAPQIRHAVGDLVYDHLICPASEGQEDDDLERQMDRILQILSEFSADPILCDYVIDALWDKCQAMKDWKCMVSMLLEESSSKDLSDLDTTNLVRVLSASVKKAVGEKIVPISEQRKTSLNKAQKEALETRKKEMTLAMVKSHAKLLRKYLADDAKVAAIVEIILHMQLSLYSLKRQEQNFASVLQLIKEAFFKHGDEKTLKGCITALAFAANESHADLQDSANQILKETADELLVKLRSAIMRVGDAEDDYSLTVNLRRLYQLQLAVNVADSTLFTDLKELLDDFTNLDDEVIRLVFLNMFLCMAWSLSVINPENVDEGSCTDLVSKRAAFMEHLQVCIDSLLDSWEQGNARSILTCTVCAILSDLWSLFSKAKLTGTTLEALGFCPSTNLLKSFWKLCEHRLTFPEDTEEEVTDGPHSSEYLNEKDAILSSAAKLIAHGMVPKAYQRHLDEVMGTDSDWTQTDSYTACKELGNRLSGTFFGFQRKEFRPSISAIVKGGIEFAFADAPLQLSFLETGVVPFALKLPAVDIRETLADVEARVEGVDTDSDPNSWRPYFTFVNILREKIIRNEPAGERENGVAGKPPRPGARKKRDLKGKKLFDKDSSSGEDEETPPASESEDAAEEEEEDDDDDNTPLFHIRQTLHQPASMAGNSHLKPPPTAVKAQKPERSKRRDEGTPSLIRSAEEDEDTDTDDVLQTARRESVVPDEPGLIGSATEEQLPANIGQDHQTKHVATTGTFLLEESTKEDSPTSSSAQENPSTDANSKGKRPASSDDEEGELAARKRSRND
ncbi:hypothetical protein BDL97_17G039000 [Sphagnum fallax]|nr:hypothetical protein BDL97_17G039000 [Sphagnum fallax]KAH8935633.1 hypothetical protein BDL97_17G039000 [Sphagnum fallax]